MPTAPALPAAPRGPARRRRRGQATTEWMLLLSVLVIAIVAGFFGLALIFQDSMSDLGTGVAEIYTTGDLAR